MCATTMRIGLTSDSRKIRQPVGQPRHVLWWKARFTLALGSGACTIVTRPPLRLRQLRFIGTSLPVQSEPRVTLSPWAALVAWTNIWPGHRIVNQTADTPSGGNLLLST